MDPLLSRAFELLHATDPASVSMLQALFQDAVHAAFGGTGESSSNPDLQTETAIPMSVQESRPRPSSNEESKQPIETLAPPRRQAVKPPAELSKAPAAATAAAAAAGGAAAAEKPAPPSRPTREHPVPERASRTTKAQPDSSVRRSGEATLLFAYSRFDNF